MGAEGRRGFIARVGAGTGLLLLGGCPPPAPTPAPKPPGPAGAAPPVLQASLRGSVLSLRYHYPKAVAALFPAAPWAATVVVSVFPPSGGPDCRSLVEGALRVEGPVMEQDVFRAAADVDLAALFGLQAPYVRYVHASFLQYRTDVLRLTQ